VNRIGKATRARFERRERNRKGRKRPFVTTDLGRSILGQIIPPLAEYIASDDAPRPPQGLETVVRQVPHDKLALVAVAALLNKIDTGWDRQDESARLKICLAIGNDLRDELEVRRLFEECPAAYKHVERAKSPQKAIWRFRRLDWSQAALARAGNWLLDCTEALDFFTLDEAGFPIIAPDHQEAVDRLREELIYKYPYYLPLLAPPSDWKGWRSRYENRIFATFVRANHPDTVKEVTAAFADGSMKQHVNGVNAIQRVPFVINEPMLPVVSTFAFELAKARAGSGFFDEEMTSNLIKRDVDTAEFLAKRGRFWTPCNIDTRGRVYGLPYFNFQREDHVRALFLFAEGEPIGNNIHWLEVAVTNHFGKKGTWGDRLAWAAKERELIRSVAADPIGTFDRWRKADDPFSFVAACMELAAAEKNRGYTTRFPVLLDGSCNGIQHLALMTRDEEAGRLVNLTDDTIQDLYSTVEDKVRERLKTSADAEAKWWLGRGRLSRALIKQPVMTFAYGVTENGAKDQIIDAYKRLHGWEDGLSDMARYLARLVRHVSDELLPRPAAAMEYIRGLTDHCTERGVPLRWRSPTGLPIGNRYKSNTSDVEMKLRGVRVRYRVADGWSSDIVKRKARDSALANFVHSRDAAHLIRSVNAAVRDGITNVVCVHDCFGTIAPRSQRFQNIIRAELGLMYIGSSVRYADSGEGLGTGLAPPEDPRWRQPPSLSHNPLAQLRGWNAGENYPPPQGNLDPTSVAYAEYTFK
jgi:hypothetical protein